MADVLELPTPQLSDEEIIERAAHEALAPHREKLEARARDLAREAPIYVSETYVGELLDRMLLDSKAIETAQNAVRAELGDIDGRRLAGAISDAVGRLRANISQAAAHERQAGLMEQEGSRPWPEWLECYDDGSPAPSDWIESRLALEG
jgi:hypothetical protein